MLSNTVCWNRNPRFRPGEQLDNHKEASAGQRHQVTMAHPETHSFPWSSFNPIQAVYTRFFTGDPVNGAEMSSDLDPTERQSTGEYQRLQEWLLITTVISGLVIGCCVALLYSLDIAANYLLGVAVGVVYLRMLAKSVGRLGNGNRKLGSGRFGVVVALLLVATQVKALHVIPIFLGFLTFKVSLIIYLFKLLTRSFRSPSTTV